MRLNVSQEDITESSIPRTVIILGIPIFVQYLVRVLQGAVDLFWLGRLGANAVAAVGLVAPLMGFLVAAVTYIPYSGTQIIVAQRVGSDDRFGARRIVFTGLSLGLLLGIVGGVLAYLGSGPIIRAITGLQSGTTSPMVISTAIRYLQIISLGAPAIVISNVIEGVYINWGDSGASLYMNLVGVVVNFALDPILIFGIGVVPQLGVVGAALATVVGYLAGVGLGIAFILTKRSGGILSKKSVEAKLEEFKEIVRIGVPSATQSIALKLANIALLAIMVATGGAVGSIAYVVGVRISEFALIPARGLQKASQTVMGQNLGAVQPSRVSRALRFGTLIASSVMMLIGAIQWAVAEQLVYVFLPALQPDAVAVSMDYLRIIALSYPALGIVFLLQSRFNAAGRTRTALASSLFQYWIVRLPIAAVGGLVLNYGVRVVFWAVAISDFATLLVLGLYYLYSVRDGELIKETHRIAGQTD